METEVGGDKLEEATVPGHGKKRPPSPGYDDGEDLSTSTSDDDRWEFSEEEQEEEEEENDEEDDEGMSPFTVDNFPRFSSDHFEQTDTIYRYPGIYLRGPSPLSLFCAFRDYHVGKKGHWFTNLYELYDESEISLNNAETIDCSEHCRCPTDLMQLIDIKIAGYRHTHPGPAKIFGFFAARDKIEPLRNYVYRRGIDNCEAVSVKQKTGMARLSLTSPARCISIGSHALFEFELCIRTEDEPNGEALIKGCTEISNMFGTESFVKSGRLYGEKCALDVKFAVLNIAVQATVDFEIVRAPARGFDLKLYAKTSGFTDVIRLFEGVAEVGHRFRSIVAVVLRRHLDLHIMGSLTDDNSRQSNEESTCRFKAWYHGMTDKAVDLDDFATVSVKVTWKNVAETQTPFM